MGQDRSTSREKMTSHGRGGAGNITSSVESAPPKDLSTPTIKSDFYTTGRGGAGNIAKNDPDRPELARASQDVEPQVSKGKQDHVHYGRGGAGNALKNTSKTTPEAIEGAEADSEQQKLKFRDDKAEAEKSEDSANSVEKDLLGIANES